MRVGIVGLPQVGKTTIFNLLTHGHASTSSWGGKAEAHIGISEVPDPHVDRLAEVFHPKKVTYATVEYVDLPGLARSDQQGQAKEMSTYINSLKNVDALMHVVRAFDDPNIPHSEGAIDPAHDIAIFELEMIFADLAIIEKRLERLLKDLKKVKSPDLEAEHALLLRIKGALEDERPIRDLELSLEEQRRIRGFTFLSAKPLLVVINLGDNDARKIPRVVEVFNLDKQSSMRNVRITSVCGKIEAEISSLPSDDARLFMDDLGLSESGLARLVQESYSLLGLFSFYTAGEPEVRAWTIPRNTTAQQAAGAIHTDIEKGFIKAEVVSFPDMIQLGSFQAAKNKGVLRLEGKDYVVREGDVILFRFNV